MAEKDTLVSPEGAFTESDEPGISSTLLVLECRKPNCSVELMLLSSCESSQGAGLGNAG